MAVEATIRQCRQPPFWLEGSAPRLLYDAVRKRGGDLRIVGGAVRDYLLQGEPVDFAGELDFASDLSPSDLKLVASDLGVRVRLHGESYGMIMFLLAGGYYEVTSLRRDVRTFGRSAEVEFGGDWRSDAERRDFTINAMSMDSSGIVYDYFGGLEDLRLGVGGALLRFVGDAESRICEDYLRILRLFRFYGVLDGSSIEGGVLDICSVHSGALLDLSVERRRDELLRLLGGIQHRSSLELMSSSGILGALGLRSDLPIIGFDISGDELVNFYLLYFSGGDYVGFCRDWRLDNVRCRLFVLVGRVIDLLGVEDLDYLLHIYGVGVVRLGILLSGRYDLWGSVLVWDFIEFPVSGGDICVRFGVSGVEVGNLLDMGLRYWLGGGRSLGCEGVLDYLGGIVGA